MKKLKVWLIHKLGGMVPEDIPPVIKKEVEIIDIHSSAVFTNTLAKSGADRENFEKYKVGILADGLARQILEQGLATVTSNPINREKYYDEYEVIATAYLIREEDARIENCDALTFKRKIPYEEAERLFKQRSNYGAW